MAPKITAEEISQHAKPDDLWILVNGKVYDLTNFAPQHPGGPDALYQCAGQDGSETYNAVHAPGLIEQELSTLEKKGDFDETSITPAWRDAQRRRDQLVSTPRNQKERPLLSTLISLRDFEDAHMLAGSEKASAYITGASNDCLTYSANLKAWQQMWFRPRILRNVARVNTGMRMLGADVRMPVFICPMGLAKTSGREGEAALARGAARGGIVHCVPTTASMSVEEVLGSTPPTYPFFYQLYVDQQRSKTEAILRKLEGLEQVKALFVTVDLPVVSKREADERVRTHEPMSQMHMPNEVKKADKKGAGLARTTSAFIDPALHWDDIPWIRRQTSKPIVIKGIQSVADAKMALQLGCAGIVISNHGGRALDNTPASLLVLLELRRDCPEVFDKMEVLVDGGIRRGSDILKAVCLGAKGVGVGRPFQCSVMYDTEGVESVASILQDELETAMKLCGVTDLDKWHGDYSPSHERVALQPGYASKLESCSTHEHAIGRNIGFANIGVDQWLFPPEDRSLRHGEQRFRPPVQHFRAQGCTRQGGHFSEDYGTRDEDRRALGPSPPAPLSANKLEHQRIGTKPSLRREWKCKTRPDPRWLRLARSFVVIFLFRLIPRFTLKEEAAALVDLKFRPKQLRSRSRDAVRRTSGAVPRAFRSTGTELSFNGIHRNISDTDSSL
nr:cytochrome b2, mitochondrial [Quercus suber]